MPAFSPAQDLGRGLKSYLRGITWLRRHPGHLALLFIPMLIGLAFVAGALSLFTLHYERIMDAVLFQRPTEWGMLIVYQVCWALAFVAMLVLTFLTALLVMNVVASPFYEIVSTAIEEELTGQGPPKLTLGQHLAVMLVEMKKVFLILFVSTLVLFIPGLNVLSTLIAAFLMGWDFFDYPLARRGWSFRRRARLVFSEFFAVLGLGLWLVVPFVQIIMLPLAVAGGTLLNLESLQRHKLFMPDKKEEL